MLYCTALTAQLVRISLKEPSILLNCTLTLCMSGHGVEEWENLKWEGKEDM